MSNLVGGADGWFPSFNFTVLSTLELRSWSEIIYPFSQPTSQKQVEQLTHLKSIPPQLPALLGGGGLVLIALTKISWHSHPVNLSQKPQWCWGQLHMAGLVTGYWESFNTPPPPSLSHILQVCNRHPSSQHGKLEDNDRITEGLHHLCIHGKWHHDWIVKSKRCILLRKLFPARPLCCRHISLVLFNWADLSLRQMFPVMLEDQQNFVLL